MSNVKSLIFAVFAGLSTLGQAAASVIGGSAVFHEGTGFGEIGLTVSEGGDTVALGGGDFELQATGGDFDGVSGVVGFEDSYLRLDNSTGATTILWDLSIDATGPVGVITGKALNSAVSTPITSLFVFEIAALASNSVNIYATSALGNVLQALYGIDPSMVAGRNLGLFSLNLLFSDDSEISSVSVSEEDVLVNPVPAALPLFLSGVFGLGFLRRKRRALKA